MTAKQAFEKFCESENIGLNEYWLYWPYFKAGVDYERKREKLNKPIKVFSEVSRKQNAPGVVS
jgi:hypothetical protein